MSIEIEFRNLYAKLIRKFDIGPIGTELFSRIMAGSERSDDYEEVLRKDMFFTSTICKTASESLKTSTVKSVGHAVVLVGQESVRNMVLGHTIERLFSPTADGEYQNFEVSEKILNYAYLAEEQAKKIKNEYVGMAFAAGYIFDIFATWIAKDPELNDEIKTLLESVWKHSLRAATMAWALASHERVLISYRKIIFAATLLHDIGKLGLAVFEPATYKKCIAKMDEARDLNPTDDSYEVQIEKEFFDLSHPEIGSALVFQTKFLQEVGMEIDFHHDATLLKMRNTDAFLGGAIINIADRMSWIAERNFGFKVEELQIVLKPHESYFPLHSQEVMEVFAQIRAKRWL